MPPFIGWRVTRAARETKATTACRDVYFAILEQNMDVGTRGMMVGSLVLPSSPGTCLPASSKFKTILALERQVGRLSTLWTNMRPPSHPIERVPTLSVGS